MKARISGAKDISCQVRRISAVYETALTGKRA